METRPLSVVRRRQKLDDEVRSVVIVSELLGESLSVHRGIDP